MRNTIVIQLTLFLALVGGSLTAFAYLHSTFVTKEMFTVIKNDINVIKTDVKELIRKSR